jgi:hypothetical protein
MADLSADGQVVLYQRVAPDAQVVSHNLAPANCRSLALPPMAQQATAIPNLASSARTGDELCSTLTPPTWNPGVEPGVGTNQGSLFRKNLETGAIELAVPTEGLLAARASLERLVTMARFRH